MLYILVLHKIKVGAASRRALNLYAQLLICVAQQRRLQTFHYVCIMPKNGWIIMDMIWSMHPASCVLYSMHSISLPCLRSIASFLRTCSWLHRQGYRTVSPYEVAS